MKRDEMFFAIVSQSEELLWSKARQCSNSVLEDTDVYSELITHLLHRLAILDPYYLQDPTPSDFNFVSWGRKIIIEKAIDITRYYSRRPDTSRYHAEIETIVETFKSEHSDSPVRLAIEHDLFEKLINRIISFEIKYPGVTNFVREALHPSETTWAKYDVYYDALKSKTVRTDKYFIPPATLAALLGISTYNLRTFQTIVWNQILALGFSKTDVRKLLSLGWDFNGYRLK